MASLSRTTSQESAISLPKPSISAEGTTRSASSVEAPAAASSTRPPPPRSRTPSHTLLHSGLNSPITSRKGRFVDAGTTEGSTNRASISMPPPAIKPTPHKPSFSRQPSGGSTMNPASNREEANCSGSNGSKTVSGLPVTEDQERTPNIQTLPASEPCSPLPLDSTLKLPPTASTTESDGNRLSFSSLYSLGSAIYNGALNAQSAPPSAASSNAGSVKNGPYDPTSTPLSPTRSSMKSELSAPTTTATDPVSVTANDHTQLQSSLSC